MSKNMEPSRADLLAMDYLNGDENDRKRVEAVIKSLPYTRLKIFFILMFTVLISLTILVNVLLYKLVQFSDPWVWIMLDGIVIAGLAKSYFVYQTSKPSVYELLVEFAERHPMAPEIKRFRTAQGHIDWQALKRFILRH